MEKYICKNMYTECAYYADIDKLVTINNTGDEQTTEIATEKGTVTVTLKPFETVIQ